jgi:pyruvate dehydrogenase E2 component (dihydrolipoamide acetyltransferase)
MAEIHAVTLPKFGLAMTEGTLAAWHKAEGDRVETGEELADVETTKITNAYESPVAGTLRRRVVDEGETVPVGSLIGVVADPTVPDAEIDAFVADFQANFDPEAAAEAGVEAVAEPETVETPEGHLQYFAAGEGEGPPIILVHGFGGDLNNWMFVQPILAESHRTYAVDLPGHGGSVKRVGQGDVPALAGALESFMDALSIEAAHLVGHSLGGAVSLALAATSPGRVRSLTLVSPAGLGPEVNMDYITGFIEARRRKDLKPVVELLFADPGLVGRDMLDDLLKYKRLDGVDEALQTMAESCFAAGRQAALYGEALANLGMPVHVIWGEQDRIIPVGHVETLPEHVRVACIGSVGHMAHMEDASAVARLIRGTVAL